MKGLRLLRWGILLTLLRSCGTVRAAETPAAPAFQMVDATTDACWIFTHLNKSGGTTVKNLLMTGWGERFYTYDSTQWRMGVRHSLSIAEDLAHGQKWNVVGGGYAESLRRSSAVSSKCKWFTMFRHPIPRMVSAYYYCMDHSSDQTCASQIVRSKHVDLLTFAKHWGNYAMKQFAMSFVSIDDVLDYALTNEVKAKLPRKVNKPRDLPGWYLLSLYLNNQTRASNTEDAPDAGLYPMLQAVQDLLRDNYSAIGILEEFNTTLSLFNAALDMPAFDWHDNYEIVGQRNENVDRTRDKEATLAEAWTNSEIKTYMYFDLLLYEHAVDIFQQQTRAHGI